MPQNQNYQKSALYCRQKFGSGATNLQIFGLKWLKLAYKLKNLKDPFTFPRYQWDKYICPILEQSDHPVALKAGFRVFPYKLSKMHA